MNATLASVGQSYKRERDEARAEVERVKRERDAAVAECKIGQLVRADGGGDEE